MHSTKRIAQQSCNSQPSRSDSADLRHGQPEQIEEEAKTHSNNAPGEKYTAKRQKPCWTCQILCTVVILHIHSHTSKIGLPNRLGPTVSVFLSTSSIFHRKNSCQVKASRSPAVRAPHPAKSSQKSSSAAGVVWLNLRSTTR